MIGCWTGVLLAPQKWFSVVIGQSRCQFRQLQVTCCLQHGCDRRERSRCRRSKKQHVPQESYLRRFSAVFASYCWMSGDQSPSLWSDSTTFNRHHARVYAGWDPGDHEGNHRGSAGWFGVSDLSWEHLPPGHETCRHPNDSTDTLNLYVF